MSFLLRDGDSVTSPWLVGLRRGVRNGNWRHLDTAYGALFHCAFRMAKASGKISNTKLMVLVLRVALKIVQTGSPIGRAGRVAIMLGKFEAWWGVQLGSKSARLHDPRYVRYVEYQR